MQKRSISIAFLLFVIIFCVTLPFTYPVVDEYFMQKPKCDISSELEEYHKRANAGCVYWWMVRC